MQCSSFDIHFKKSKYYHVISYRLICHSCVIVTVVTQGLLPVLPLTQASLLFQSSPKGPTIPYKPQQFSVPPPSPSSPSLSCQSDSSFVSPPPCPPGPPNVPLALDSIQVLPPMFPQPMMTAQPYMAGSPCVRYTTIPSLPSLPCHQTMFSLALPDQAAVKPPGQPGPPVVCGHLGQGPEASRLRE